jgi:hypothetical protein
VGENHGIRQVACEVTSTSKSKSTLIVDEHPVSTPKKPMQIERPHNSAIIFRESRKGSCTFVFILSATIIGWEWMVWGGPTSLEEFWTFTNPSSDLPQSVLYVLAGLPLLVGPLMLRRLIVAIFGRVIAFDALSRTITKNNRILAGFDDVERFDLKKWDDSNVRLNLFLNSGKKIGVGKLCHTKEFERVKTEIGELLKRTEPFEKTAERPETSDAYLPLSIIYYLVRGFSIFLFLGSVLLPIVTAMNLTDRLKIQGHVWAGSIFLFLFGLLLYGVSWFVKNLRLTWR